MHSRKATYTCVKPTVSKDVAGGNVSPGRRFSRRNHGKAHSTNLNRVNQILSYRINWCDLRQTPPANAISTLNAFVLFSTLLSDLIPFRIPTITARIRISPAEQTANDIFEILFLSIDSRSAWSSALVLQSGEINVEMINWQTDDFVPSVTWIADSCISGRSRARPGNAAVQKVREH